MKILFPFLGFNLPSVWLTHDLSAMTRDLGMDVISAAFNPKGCTPHIVREVYDKYKPDLVVAVNFARRNYLGGIPDGVPFLTVMQDVCEDINTPEWAKSFNESPSDFIVGYVDRLSEAGYDMKRVRKMDLPISPGKFFSAGRFDRARKRGVLKSEKVGWSTFAGGRGYDPIEWAARKDSWHKTLGVDTRDIIRVVECLKTKVATQESLLFDEVHEEFLKVPSVRAKKDSLPRSAWDSLFEVHFYWPLYEPLFRQAVVRRISRERRVKIAGNSWCANPEFSEWSRPSIPHGPELADFYTGGDTSLHISSRHEVHHRVLEILTSAGVCEIHGAKGVSMRQWTQKAAEKFISDQNKTLLSVFSLDIFKRNA